MTLKKIYSLLALILICFIIIIMAEPTWDALAKNQTDPQLITEYITAAIAAHEADPEAHLGPGESLEQHKTNDVIDHPAFSIVNDKLEPRGVTPDKFSFTKDYIDVNFESLDSWSQSGAGTLFQNLGGVGLQTTTSNNNIKQLYALGDPFAIDFATKNPVFECVANLVVNTNATIYLGIGEPVSDAGDFLGFKIVNGVVKGVIMKAGVETLTAALTLSPFNAYHDFRVEYTSGVQADFYLDNVLVATLSTGLITSSETLSIFAFYIKTTTTASKIFFIKHCLFYQDL